MDLKVFNDISKLKKDTWEKYFDNDNLFVNYNFLTQFSKYHKNFEHLFIVNGKNRFYGNIFNVKLQGLKNYSKNFIFRFILGLFDFNFFYLTNSQITNASSFDIKENFSLEKIISKVTNEKKINFVVIPDYLFQNSKNNFYLQDYVKVEIEEDMKLTISSKWNDFNSYKSDLKTKYRKKINTIFKNSNSLKIRVLTRSDLSTYKSEMQNLFNDVIKTNKFQGPKFNVEFFQSIISDFDSFNVYGYFLDNQMVAFSSEFLNNENLYSYFVGINYNLNKKYSIYERILCEAINNAIKNKNKNVIFGRTANEFKSNFGAVPKRSYVYFKAQNKFVAILLKEFLKNIKPKSWIQRNPFKESI